MKTLLKIEMDEQRVGLFIPENTPEMAGYIAMAMNDAAENNPVLRATLYSVVEELLRSHPKDLEHMLENLSKKNNVIKIKPNSTKS